VRARWGDFEVNATRSTENTLELGNVSVGGQVREARQHTSRIGEKQRETALGEKARLQKEGCRLQSSSPIRNDAERYERKERRFEWEMARVKREE
jgi:hypothetical protein